MISACMHSCNPIVLNSFIIISGKSDAKGKICRAEAALGRFGLDPKATSTEQLSVPWLLSKEDVELATERLSQIKYRLMLIAIPSTFSVTHIGLNHMIHMLLMSLYIYMCICNMCYPNFSGRNVYVATYTYNIHARPVYLIYVYLN